MTDVRVGQNTPGVCYPVAVGNLLKVSSENEDSSLGFQRSIENI